MPELPDPRCRVYESDAEILAGELERLDALLRLRVAQLRRTFVDDPAYHGVVVSDREVDALLDRGVAAPPWASVAIDDELAALADAFADRSELHEARVALTLAGGPPLRLLGLAAGCGLGALDRLVLTLAIAPALDLRYERVIGWLHDDASRRRPSVGLVVDLLAADLGDRLACQAELLGEDAPLLAAGALELLDDPDHPSSPLRRTLRPRPGVIAWLSGQIPRDPALTGVAERLAVDPDEPPPIWGSALAGTFTGLAGGPSGPRLIRLSAPAGAGRRTFAARLAATRGAPLYWVDGEAAAALDPAAFRGLLGALRLALRLEGACLGWPGLDAAAPPRSAEVLELCAALHPPFTFFSADRSWQPTRAPAGLPPVEPVALPLPDARERSALLRRALPEADDAAIDAAAGTFRFTPGRLRDAAASARGLARARGEASPSRADLLTACRDHAIPRLGALATLVAATYTWEDLVVPADRRALLDELVRRVRHRDQVLDVWGFGARHSAARGVSALFSGPPGTGKTMAAAVVARETGRDLYRIDLSQIVSKYIGETEKHLERVFAEAEAADVALFFDEADAIFGKRSEIKDAHDRYANIEVSYLLQRIETYPGIVILASNFRKNLDEAFMRRLQVIVELGLPGEEERATIWRGIWPADAPLADDFDADELARRFEISGGHIRNIAVAAAFAAAEAGTAIGMAEILCAAQSEYRKIGKLVSADRFQVPAPRERRS